MVQQPCPSFLPLFPGPTLSLAVLSVSSCSLCNHSFLPPSSYQQPLGSSFQDIFSACTVKTQNRPGKPHVRALPGAAQMGKTRQVCTSLCLCGSCCSKKPPFTPSPLLLLDSGTRVHHFPGRRDPILLTGRADRQPLPSSHCQALGVETI